MRKKLFFLLLSSSVISAQSYAPAAGKEGSTAIARSSEDIIAWATGIKVVRGPQNITNPTGLYASSGDDTNGLRGGTSGNSVVCLGDGGTAVLTFDAPVANIEGYDFAVFENGFSDTYLELAFVEISSDGVNFFRFPCHSQTQTITPVGGFGAVDCTFINNFAGKYRTGFGTPFDISEVPDNLLLDKNNITHVKIVDAIGTIDPAYASYDSQGNMVNEQYPTPYATGGFDLSGVAVLKVKTTLGNPNFNANAIALYPNPASGVVFMNTNKESSLLIYDVLGQLVKTFPKSFYTNIDISDLKPGTYVFSILIENTKTIKVMIIK